jgi:hypothetical protein
MNELFKENANTRNTNNDNPSVDACKPVSLMVQARMHDRDPCEVDAKAMIAVFHGATIEPRDIRHYAQCDANAHHQAHCQAHHTFHHEHDDCADGSRRGSNKRHRQH